MSDYSIQACAKSNNGLTDNYLTKFNNLAIISCSGFVYKQPWPTTPTLHMHDEQATTTLPVRESQKRHGIAQRMLRGVSTNLYQISCSPLLFNAFICGRDGERGVLKPFSDMDYCNVALAGLPSCDRYQRCRTPDSWRAAPWPHHSAPWWPPLAADASAHSVQAAYVRTGCVHGSAPSYLQNAICPGRECGWRRRLRSASSADLIVPATRRWTMGDRAFAGPRAWTVCPTRSVAAHRWLY